MEDVGPVRQQRAQVGVLNPRFHEPETRMPPRRGEIPLLVGPRIVVGKAVDADDIGAVRQQAIGEGRADESGDAGDKRFHVNSWQTRSGSRHGRPSRSMEA